ncbi:MAG: hypothetical protein NTV01_18765, partial [Bacteroidia bacterium]|nr:hypothetical protein [Bacteroidia bacterium]
KKCEGERVCVVSVVRRCSIHHEVATSHPRTNPSRPFFPMRHCHPGEGRDRYPYPHRFELDFNYLFTYG